MRVILLIDYALAILRSGSVLFFRAVHDARPRSAEVRGRVDRPYVPVAHHRQLRPSRSAAAPGAAGLVRERFAISRGLPTSATATTVPEPPEDHGDTPTLGLTSLLSHVCIT